MSEILRKTLSGSLVREQIGTVKVLAVTFSLIMAPDIIALGIEPLVLPFFSNHGAKLASWAGSLPGLALAIWVGAYLAARVGNSEARGYLWRMPQARWFAAAIVLALGSFLVLNYGYTHVYDNDAVRLNAERQRFRTDMAVLPLGAVALYHFLSLMMRPIFEEVLFRGLLLRHFAARFHWLVGVLVSSALFVLIHRPHWVVVSMVALSAAFLALRSRSLLAPVLLHVAYNSMITLDALR